MLTRPRHAAQRRFDFNPHTAAPARGWLAREAVLLGTTVRVEAWRDLPDGSDADLVSALRAMLQIDQLTHPRRATSELARVQRQAGCGPVVLSEPLLRWLARLVDLAELTGGSFEPVVGAGGWRALELDRGAATLALARPGLRFDLAGSARAWAVDTAIQVLQLRGVRHAIVSAGGASRMLGDHRGRAWTVGVRDPRRPDEALAVLPIEDAAVATVAAAAGSSATVLAPDAVTADALAHAAARRGGVGGIALVGGFAGLDAVVVDADGSVHGTPGIVGAVGAAGLQGLGSGFASSRSAG